jgi:MFS family permease
VTAGTIERPTTTDAGGETRAAGWMAVLIVAVMAFSLGQTALYPALPAIADQLGTSIDAATWTITAYLLSAAVCTPVVGRLSDVYGTRVMLQVVLWLLIVGGVVAAVTGTLAGVIAGRIIQGGAGGLLPVCFAIIRRSSSARHTGTRIGLLSSVTGGGAAIGLVVGGLLTDHIGFEAVFWLVAVLAAISSVAAWRFVPASPGRGGRVDLRGVPLLAIGLALPLVAVSEGNRWGWLSPQTLVLLGVGALALVLWVRVERRSPMPMADIEMLSRPKVMLVNGTTLLIGWAMIGAFILTPQLLEAPKSTGYGFGLNAAQAGLLMLPATLAALVWGPLSARIGARSGNRVSLVLGAAVSCVGCTLLALNHSSALIIVLFLVVTSTGNNLSFAAMPNAIVECVEPHETGQATGQNVVVRLVGSSVGAAVATAVLAGHVAPSGFPTNSGYTVAYAIAALVALAAGLLALAIPSKVPRRRRIVVALPTANADKGGGP